MGHIKLGSFEAIWGKDRASNAVGSPGTGTILPEDAEMQRIAKELSDIVFPVESIGRQSIPDYKNLSTAMGDLLLINPEFNSQWIEALETLAMFDPDVSNSIENNSLANTSFKTFFDEDVPDSVQREAQSFLTESRDHWYGYGDGFNGFIDDILVQCSYSGAMSYEILPNPFPRIDGVSRLEIVNPKNILFYRESMTQPVYPIQKIPSQYINVYGGGNVIGQYKKLNTTTYRYSGLRRMGENPIAIPPFLAGMESLMVRRDMQKNLNMVVKKLGVLGFLKVMLNRPTIKSGESPKEFQDRARTELQENVNAVKRGFDNNFMLGYNKEIEIDFQSSTTNTTGAEALIDIQDRSMITGLKQSMEMMNRKNTTSETFGRVILVKMGAQLKKYQNLLAANVSYIDLMHLQLAGYPIKKVITKFEPVMLGDRYKEQQARSLEIDNADKLYNTGVINQDTKANLLGYDKADQADPRAGDTIPKPIGLDPNKGNENDATDPKKTSANVKLRLPMKFIKTLRDIEEYGEGFHIVDLSFEDPADNLEGVVVINGQWMMLKEMVEPEQIIGISAKKKGEAIVAYNSFLLGGLIEEFDYCEDHYALHRTQELPRKAWHHVPDNRVLDSYANKKDRKLHQGYQNAIEKQYLEFVNNSTKRIATALKTLDSKASVEQAVNVIMGSTFIEFEQSFRQQIRKPVSQFVNDLYDNFRRQKTPFIGKKVPDAVFNLQDFRTMDFYQRSDNLYLGKFLTDKDTVNRLNKWIQTQYFENNLPIGKDSVGIEKFKDEFGETLLHEDWKIERIINTTVNKLRNYGAVSYMQQVGVTEFVQRSIPDSLRCEYCAAMDGKVLDVNVEYEKIETLTGSDPSATPSISPFLTSMKLSPEEIDGMSGAALQEQGVGAPGNHPNCRCTIVIIKE